MMNTQILVHPFNALFLNKSQRHNVIAVPRRQPHPTFRSRIQITHSLAYLSSNNCFDITAIPQKKCARPCPTLFRHRRFCDGQHELPPFIRITKLQFKHILPQSRGSIRFIVRYRINTVLPLLSQTVLLFPMSCDVLISIFPA